MCPLLKPQIFEEKQFIYVENEKVDDIFFLISGKAAFVLPRYKNLMYINVTIGHMFGLIDIIGYLQTNNIELDNWYVNRQNMFRQFSVQSINYSEVLALSVDNLFRLEQEFSYTFKMMC
jgi:hypothetical protein